jgi:hypothetical protein
MIRIVLVNLLFILFPAALYFFYVYLRRRNKPGEEILSDAPIFWLLAAGVAMMIVSLAFFAHWQGAPPGKRYVPPRIENGVVIPGHMEE